MRHGVPWSRKTIGGGLHERTALKQGATVNKAGGLYLEQQTFAANSRHVIVAMYGMVFLWLWISGDQLNMNMGFLIV